MKTSTIWISYDLGVRGDYEGLYAWLDSHGAKECGDALAVIAYDYDGSMIDRLRADLKKSVKTDRRSRIYVIYREPSTNKNKGTFLFGGRRAAVWTGYSPSEPSAVDEEV